MSLNPYNAEEAFQRFNHRCSIAIGICSVTFFVAFVGIVILFCLERTP